MDGILNLIESVSEGFPSYFFNDSLLLKKIRNLTKLDFKLFYPFLVHIKENAFSFPAITYKL